MVAMSLIVTALALASAAQASAETSEPPGAVSTSPTTETAGQARIHRLIKQLSDDSFSRRQFAAEHLQAIGVPALEALRRVASTNNPDVRARAQKVIDAIENSLDGLLLLYRKFDLPMPSKEARLVQYETSIVTDKGKHIVHHLAFELCKNARAERVRLLKGVWELPSHGMWMQFLDNPRIREIAPEPEAVKDLDLGLDDGLAAAIQCHARGWDGLARYLFGRSRQNATASPRKQLLLKAWDYLEGQLAEPATDRASITRRLKDLICEVRELDTEPHRSILRGLDLTLLPSKANPGSIDALIDDLVDYNTDTGRPGRFFPFQERGERYWCVADLGFAAVPSLIRHLDDERLTRAMMQGFNNFPSWHLRVNDVVSDLLEGLAGHDIGRDWLRRQQGYAVDKKQASDWWKGAHRMGEETYLVQHVLVPGEEKDELITIPNHILRLIEKKYPNRIPEIYRAALTRQASVDSAPLAEAVLRLKIPLSDKRDLLAYACDSQQQSQRWPALRAFRSIDDGRFVTLLINEIEKIPTEVDCQYWLYPMGKVGSLVEECEDLRVWRAMEKAGRRLCVGMRMEMLEYFGEASEVPQQRERLGFLAAFLDDGTVRDLSSGRKFDPPTGAASDYPKIEVRNYAAVLLARLLGMSIDVKTARPPEEWAAIRTRVRTAVDRELAKKKRGP